MAQQSLADTHVRPRGAPRAGSLRRREELTGYLFASPIIVGLVAFAAYPVLAMVYYSFNDYNVIRPPFWIGWQNYSDLLTDDPQFWTSLVNTLIYSAVAVPLGLVLSLSLAMLLNNKLRGIGIFRALVYLPSVVPTVAATILWLWILNPQYGVINNLLATFGITGPNWLGDPVWTKPALIMMSVWGIGPTVVIFLAGLQDIPAIMYEAAEIDGAGRLGRFRHITLPLITPTLFFNLVLGIIGALQVFSQPYIFAGGNGGGGPEDSILLYVVYLYARAFRDFAMGYASAMALILFILILILTLIVTASSRRWVYYEGQRQ